MSDLFDFFRENASKLQEQPADKVWKRLERRLIRRRRRAKLIFPIWIAAMSLGLLLMAAFLVYYFLRHA